MKKFLELCFLKATGLFKKTKVFLKDNNQKLLTFSFLILSIVIISFWYHYEQKKVMELKEQSSSHLLGNSLSSLSSLVRNKGNNPVVKKESKVKVEHKKPSKNQTNNPDEISTSEQSILRNVKEINLQGQNEVINDKIAPQNTSNSISSTNQPSLDLNSYYKILISEVQISGSKDEKEAFVELYNPNDRDVDLTGWYIHRKTRSGSDYSTFAPNNLFSGKKIVARSYFLVTRKGYFNNLADVFVDNPLTEDNSLALKNPEGKIVDKLGWGKAQDYENSAAKVFMAGQSIGRRENQDTDDNFKDFELNIPTPRSANLAYVSLLSSQPPPPLPQSVPQLPSSLPLPLSLPLPPSLPATLPPPDPPKQPIIPASSEPLPNSPVNNSIKILINEVQSYGKDSNDQFVKLYNPSSVAVNLKGFTLKKKSSTGNESILVSASSFSGTIPALGFFLITPKDYSGSANPDLHYSGSSYSLAQKDNSVLLYNVSGILVDQVTFGQVQGVLNSFICPNQNQCIPKGKSIERKQLGSDTGSNSQDFSVMDNPTLNIFYGH